MATGRSPPTPPWNGESSPRSRSINAASTATTEPMSTAWTTARSPRSAKNIMYPKITAAMKNSTIQSVVGITPTAPCTRSQPRLLARRGLVEPLVVGGLLRVRPRPHLPEAQVQLDAPRVQRVTLRALTRPVPLAVYDRAPVADELARQLSRDRLGQELGVLDLLDEDQRLLLGARPRLVIAREGEEDDEAQEHREARRQHAEDPRRAIAVGEVAALGRPAADEQQGGDRRPGGEGDDEKPPDDVHRLDPAAPSGRSGPAAPDEPVAVPPSGGPASCPPGAPCASRRGSRGRSRRR